MMLKYLPITALAAIVDLVLVSNNSIQTANAEIYHPGLFPADRQQKLITKGIN